MTRTPRHLMSRTAPTPGPAPTARPSLAARFRRDDGASLVMAMVFLMCVGLVTMALAGYAQAGIASMRATESRHLLASDAGGALDVAINTLRTSGYASDREVCPVEGLVVPGAGGDPVRVTCTPEAGTGVAIDALSSVDLRVYLAAYVCIDPATACAKEPPPAAVWRRIGRAIVSLTTPISVPTDGSRGVTVASWHLLE